jgi:short-subunit dehydrogenase
MPAATACRCTDTHARRRANTLGSASICAFDLTDAGAATRIAAFVREQHRSLDLLVNDASPARPGAFADRGLRGVERHVDLNFFAAVRLTEALLHWLTETLDR